MAIRDIHMLGSPVLRHRAEEIAAVDDEVRALVDDLFDTMAAASGVGLAANQIGVTRRVAVINADGQTFAMINPRIVEADGRDGKEEGCLSIPDAFAEVTRPERDRARGAQRSGRDRSASSHRPGRPRHPARTRSSRRRALHRSPEPAQAPAAGVALEEGASQRTADAHAGPRGAESERADARRLLRHARVRSAEPVGVARRRTSMSSPW